MSLDIVRREQAICSSLCPLTQSQCGDLCASVELESHVRCSSHCDGVV